MQKRMKKNNAKSFQNFLIQRDRDYSLARNKRIDKFKYTLAALLFTRHGESKKKLKINFWPYSQCHKRPHRKAKIKILLYSSIPSPHFNKISFLSPFFPLLFVCLWKLATVLQLHQMLKAAILIISIIFITTQFLISHMFIAMPFFLFIPLSLSLSQSSQSSC